MTELLFRITAAACNGFRDAYAQMQASPQPGKLVHHHASTSEQALPTPPRCAANATRQNRRARGRVTRNPHPGKKSVGQSTHAH